MKIVSSIVNHSGRSLGLLLLSIMMLAACGCAKPNGNQGGIAGIQRAYLTGDYKSAQRLAHSCYELNSGTATGYEARYWEGMSIMALGQPANARTPLQEVAESSPDRTVRILALRGLAKAELSAGDADSAEGTWKRLQKQYPKEIDEAEMDRALAECEAVRCGKPRSAASGGSSAPEQQGGSMGSGQYSVQSGIFSSRQRADEMVARLKTSNFQATVIPIQGKPLFAVVCGRFPSKAAAQSRVNQLKQLGFDAIVKE